MSNQLQAILARWHPEKDRQKWVLVSVIQVEGSHYRPVGSAMLISEQGERLGLVSGGCIETSLLNAVKKVIQLSRPLKVDIASMADGNFPKLGCGGKVMLWLQLVTRETKFQSLDRLFVALQERKAVLYSIDLTELQASGNRVLPMDAPLAASEQLVISPKPQWHLGIFGGGVDAVPLVQMAKTLGWLATVVDSRSGFARESEFPNTHIVRQNSHSEAVKSLVKVLDAAVIMTHNLDEDAAALECLLDSQVTYIGLLGPKHRRAKVFELLGQPDCPRVQGPMGLNLGGDLPEMIALSVLAQIHQTLWQRDQNV